jgi:hypothetical protein
VRNGTGKEEERKGTVYLVGGEPTPLKNMKVSWDDSKVNGTSLKIKDGPKPPTRIGL